MCVIGNEMAGKTTLVNSLLKLNRPSVKLEDRTACIEIHDCEIPGVGKGTTWDFGTQLTFQKAHGLFFRQSNTMFCLVLPIEEGKMKSEEDLVEEGQFWCAFVKASLRTLPPCMKSLIRLFIIINLIGEKVQMATTLQLERVVEVLEKKFGNTFLISHVITMDCSKSQSVEMKDFREKLRRIREEMLEVLRSRFVGLNLSFFRFRRQPVMFPNFATPLRSIFLLPTTREISLWTIF